MTEPPEELARLVWWILGPDGRTPRAVGFLEGSSWVGRHGTVRVAFDEDERGEVSTVFVPRLLDPGIEVSLFQTKALTRGGHESFGRWDTWDEALAGHARMHGEMRPAGCTLH